MSCEGRKRTFLEALASALYKDADGEVHFNIELFRTDCEEITPALTCDEGYITPELQLESAFGEDECGNTTLKIGYAFGSNISNIRTINESDTQLSSDEIIVCDGANITLTLLEATGSNKILHIKNINATDLTVEGDGGDTIDDELYQTLSEWENMMILDYAVGEWLIL